MIIRARNFIIFSVMMAVYCSPLSNGGNRNPDLPHPGMRKISSAGKTFQQGWNDVSASLDEKPGMASSFSYNYWLDTTDVTQRQYYEFTGKQPVSSGSAYGAGDDYPVYNVSWFDAVLYCNGRSKAGGLDSVYTYSGTKALSNGTVYELTGVRADLSHDGYRLPTEAEWEFAAREASSSLPYTVAADSSIACNYAWWSENSSGKTHVVGTRLPNSLGLYDMAGNVFEWTNDWKGYYNGKNITNSLGALQPDGDYEKVIKGGSFNYGLMYLRPSHRSATYSTILSSANEYVGFRCARGPITTGQYIGAGQDTLTPNPLTIMAGAGDMLSFAGTSVSKLVFVNVTGPNRTLCYVDFSRTFPYLQEYLDDRNVYMPTISPNGRYVAYCSADVGLSGPSEVTIRSLDSLNSPKVKLDSNPAYIPRWWIDSLTKETYLIYTNSAVENGNEALWRSTKTYMQKISEGTPDGAPVELVSDGSYHDGLSIDKRYIVTGFNRLMVKDLQTSITSQLFLSPANGKDATGSTQVCNVSISPDTGSNVRCMFLDFGYPAKSAVTGSSYGVHQYLFVSKMTDSITYYMHCPDGEQSWDNTEWSNQAQFAVGCGRNSSDQAHAIYAIDLQKKGFRQIVIGVELQQPYLWLGSIADISQIFSLDSLGRYDDPPVTVGQRYLADKLLLFWQICESLNIAVVGSSQAYNDIDPRKFTEGLNAFNFAGSGNSLLGEKIMILNYLLKHCPAIKLICTSFELFWLANPDGDIEWKVSLGQSKGYLYDSSHAFWPGSVTSDFKKSISQVPLADPYDTTCLGFFGFTSNGWGSDPPPYWGSSWDTSDTNYKQNMATIHMLADSVRSIGVHLLIINSPICPYYKNTEYYSWLGPSRQTARNIIQVMEELDTANEFVHFYDANMDGNHDYGDEDAYDLGHLSATGAAKLSTRIDSIIKTILH